MISADVIVVTVPSIGGSLYVLSIIDHKSRYLWVYLLKRKSDVYENFVKWVNLVENLTERRIKKIKTDKW